ncbi:MAG: hypothetical protein R3277_00365 [Brumimicrobium sp.]|nr:hypothetical protein [Brumimicrobium sp.]
MKQVRCPNCNNWSENVNVCVHCGEILNAEKKAVIAGEKESKFKKPTPPGKLQKFLEYSRTSKNPFIRFLYYIAVSIWAIYVGLVLFVMYLVVAASG